MTDDDGNRNKDKPSASPNKPPYQEKEEDMKIWGILLFGLIGATATTFAVSFIIIVFFFVCFSFFLVILNSQPETFLCVIVNLGDFLFYLIDQMELLGFPILY
jgi:hypothetical protein